MPRDDKLKESIEIHEVEAAIKAVKEKGWDINPFTIAEEAGVEPFLISRSAEFMKLLIKARGGDVTFGTIEDEETEDTSDIRSELEATSDIPNLSHLDRLLTESHEEAENASSQMTEVPDQPGQRYDTGEHAAPQPAETQAEVSPQPPQAIENAPISPPPQDVAQPAPETPASLIEDELLNEQVKALLSSESEEQVKQMEQELEQAYTRIADLEDETRDLNRSVIGLEKVNEALNVRLRELEEQAKSNVQIEKSGSENELTAANQQLSAENRVLNDRLKELEVNHESLIKSHSEQEAMILELEGKLSELQQEADNLALQLQNAFHVGYQKGMTDSKQQQQQEQQAAAGQSTAPQPSGAPPVPSQETHQTQTFPEYTGVQPVVSEADLGSQAQAGGEKQVLNFAQTGPYVESKYNPLESLTWRELETVYSMGVLSIKDLSQHLEGYAGAQEEGVPTFAKPDGMDDSEETIDTPYAGDPAAMGQTLSYTNLDSVTNEKPITEVPAAPPEPRKVAHPPSDPVTSTLIEVPVVDLSEALSHDSLVASPAPPVTSTLIEAPVIDLSEALSSDSLVASPPLPMPKSQSAEILGEMPKDEGLDLLNPNDVLDFDKLDIFENLEELEDLGQIDVLAGPLNLSPEADNQVGVQTGDTPPVSADSPLRGASNEELQQLIRSRFEQHKQGVIEHTVRTPPPPDPENDPSKGKPYSPGLKSKFVGQKAAPQQGQGQQQAAPGEEKTAQQEKPSSVIHSKAISPEVRRACGLLGLRPDEVTKEVVVREWKKQAAAVHPDRPGGNPELARELNQAKEILLRWLEQTTPKLGSKFGKKT